MNKKPERKRDSLKELLLSLAAYHKKAKGKTRPAKK